MVLLWVPPTKPMVPRLLSHISHIKKKKKEEKLEGKKENYERVSELWGQYLAEREDH